MDLRSLLQTVEDDVIDSFFDLKHCIFSAFTTDRHSAGASDRGEKTRGIEI